MAWGGIHSRLAFVGVEKKQFLVFEPYFWLQIC